MPTHPRTSPAANGASRGNLFLEADPEEPLTPPRPQRQAPAGTRTDASRGRGSRLVLPLDPTAATALRGSGPARFTRPGGRVGRLATAAREKLRQADVRASELLAGLAARRLGALVAMAMLAAVLIALSWLGLARHTTARRQAPERAQITADAALTRDRARIEELTAQLAQAQLLARRQHASAAAPTGQVRAATAEVRPAPARRPRR